jgi:hypothetical protein
MEISGISLKELLTLRISGRISVLHVISKTDFHILCPYFLFALPSVLIYIKTLFHISEAHADIPL